jgi:hypothetical protein
VSRGYLWKHIPTQHWFVPVLSACSVQVLRKTYGSSSIKIRNWMNPSRRFWRVQGHRLSTGGVARRSSSTPKLLILKLWVQTSKLQTRYGFEIGSSSTYVSDRRCTSVVNIRSGNLTKRMNLPATINITSNVPKLCLLIWEANRVVFGNFCL